MQYLIYLVILLVLIGLGLATFNYFPQFKSNASKRKSNRDKVKAPPIIGEKQNSISGDTNQLSTIFSALDDGLVLVDPKGMIVLFNSAAAAMTGWNVDDAINIGVNTVIKMADDQGNSFAGSSYPFTKVLSSGEPFKDSSGFVINKDNAKIAVGLSIMPLKDNAGKVTGAAALMRNITEEKQQENRLADFISTASHEMRTPVAAIQGYLSLALNNKVATVDDKAREYLVKAEAATRHLGTLFQDLLTSAKAEDGRLVNHPQVVELGSYIKGLTEDLKFAAEKHGLSSEFTIGSTAMTKSAIDHEGTKTIAPLYYAYVDPDRLREVITNLYDNAVKYTAQGKITIGITGDDQVVQFYIQDTGSGIPAEDIPHLFQKFYRVDNSATRTIGGNGLGLFICRKIVELYGGRIWVESEVGKGSTFYINVPRLSAKKAAEMTEALPSNEIRPTNQTQTTSKTMAMT